MMDKEFPIFWTFIKNKYNGEITIHQVKFSSLVVEARSNVINDKVGVPRVYHAIFSLAGRVGLYGYSRVPTTSEIKPFGMDKIFATKEQAIACAKEQEHKMDFERGGYMCQYNPLRFSDFAWHANLQDGINLNNTDEENKGKKTNVVYPSAWFWNGVEPKNEMVKCSYGCVGEELSYIDRTCNIDWLNKDEDLNGRPLYDMVTRKWLGTHKQKYFRYKKQCEEENDIKVFEFPKSCSISM